jgi:hypothetical protein
MTTLVVKANSNWSNPMIAKSLIAAAAIAGSVIALAPVDASAKTNWDISIGLGGFLPSYEVYDAPIYVEPRPVYHAPRYIYEDDYGYEPRVRRHREVRRYEVQYDNGISCKRGARVLRHEGFHDVEAYDCSAPTYGYSAWKDGDLYKVRLNSDGDIVSVRQID